MIGIIFNTLEKLVIRDFGEDAWDQILDDSDSDGVFNSIAEYNDKIILDMVGSASSQLKLPEPDILRWFGSNAIGEFIGIWPTLFDRYDHIFDFVLSLNDIIHPHVKQLYPNAEVPHFNLISREDNVLTIEYISRRQMCFLAEGLIHGTAMQLDQKVTVTQPVCGHDTGGPCHLRIEVHD